MFLFNLSACEKFTEYDFVDLSLISFAINHSEFNNSMQILLVDLLKSAKLCLVFSCELSVLLLIVVTSCSTEW